MLQLDGSISEEARRSNFDDGSRDANGHWKSGYEPGSFTTTGDDHNPGYVDYEYDDMDYGYGSCYMADLEPSDHRSTNLWLVDSGCSNHLTPFEGDFVSRQSHINKCKTANGSIISVYGPGTVLVKHFNGQETVTLTLSGVWYAPHIQHRLLSVTALTSLGFTCAIAGTKTQFFDKDSRLVLSASPRHSQDRLHWLQAHMLEPDVSCKTIQKEDDYLLWHAHFGHSSHNVL
jgi:hypothetical protein